MQSTSVLSLILLSASLTAQTTWTVCASGGAQFSTIAAAVAAAADGDTIVCLPPQFGTALTGFTTSKGVTIVGGSGPWAIPIRADATSPIVVQGLPAGRAFRMAGFQFIQDGQLRIDVQSCQGHVHLEDIGARDFDFFFPNGPSIVVANSASVTLRAIATFGMPALQVDNSRLVAERCGFGVPLAGLRGGSGVVANGSELDLAQCVVDTGSLSLGPNQHVPAISATNSVVRIGGDGNARVAGGAAGAPGGIPIVANGGSVAIDPMVVVVPGLGQPIFSGSAAFLVQPTPATWTSPATLGQLLELRTSAPAGAVVFQAVGVASALQSTPFGSLGVDLGQPLLFFPAAAPTVSGWASASILVPASLQPGSAFAGQSAVAVGGQLTLSSPASFVVL